MVNKYALTLEEFRVMILANDRFNLRTSQNNNNKKKWGDKNSPKHFLWIKWGENTNLCVKVMNSKQHEKEKNSHVVQISRFTEVNVFNNNESIACTIVSSPSL